MWHHYQLINNNLLKWWGVATLRWTSTNFTATDVCKHTKTYRRLVTIMTACFFWRVVISQSPPSYQCNQRVRNTVKNNSEKGKFFFFSNYPAPEQMKVIKSGTCWHESTLRMEETRVYTWRKLSNLLKLGPRTMIEKVGGYGFFQDGHPSNRREAVFPFSASRAPSTSGVF